MNILIAGATGRVGAELVAQLASTGRNVRAMTGRPNAYIAPPSVHVVAEDLDDPAGRCKGVDLVSTGRLADHSLTRLRPHNAKSPA